MTQPPDAPDAEASPCDYCGAPVPESTWFGLEVQQPGQRVPAGKFDGVNWINVVFCSQEHAALWLRVPLPPPEPPSQVARPDWKERIQLGLIFGAVLVVLGLAIVGGFTIVRHLLSMS